MRLEYQKGRLIEAVTYQLQQRFHQCLHVVRVRPSQGLGAGKYPLHLMLATKGVLTPYPLVPQLPLRELDQIHLI